MQAAQRQTSSRQSLVDLGSAEWQDLPGASPPTLEALDTRPKLGDDGFGDGLTHSKNGSFQGFPALL